MAYARGKITLQDTFSVMGNSRKSFTAPFHVQRSSLFTKQVSNIRPLSTNASVSVVSGGLGMTRIIPLLDSISSKTQSFSTSTDSQSMAKKVLFADEVVISSLRFSEPKKNSKGGTYFGLFYQHDGVKLRVQTPVLRVPFDIFKKTDVNTGIPVLNFALSLDGKDTEPGIQKFVTLVNQIDEQVKNVALKHATILFPNKPGISKEVLDYQFRTTVRPAKDPTKYAPVVKFRVPTDAQGVFNITVQDGNTKEIMQLSAITKNSRVMCLVEPNMIWFVGGQFGISWNLISIRVVHRAESSVPEFRDVEEGDFR